MNAIENEYAYATEVNLATLDELISVKATSNSRIERQRGICLKMLLVCKEVEGAIRWNGYGYGRVREILDGAKSEPEAIKGALDRRIADMKATYARIRSPKTA